MEMVNVNIPAKRPKNAAFHLLVNAVARTTVKVSIDSMTPVKKVANNVEIIKPEALPSHVLQSPFKG